MENHSTEIETVAAPAEGIRPLQAIARLGGRLLDMAADFIATQEGEISDSNRYAAHRPVKSNE